MKYYRLFIILIICFYMFACEKRETPTAMMSANSLAQPVKKPLLVIKPNSLASQPTSITHAHAHNDPFTSNNLTTTTQTITNTESNNPPLTKYPLKELTMVGTIRQANQLTALILTPTGLVYRIATGDKLGQEQDSVIAINDTTLILNANASNKNPNTESKQMTLSMP